MGMVIQDTDATAQDVRPPCLVTSLGWLFSQAHFALAHQMTAALTDLGISPRAFHVLQTARTREWTQTELADAVGLDKTTMVVTIDELEAAGLAERRPAEHDRRARVIAVTAAGARKATKAQRVVEQVQADVLEVIPEEDRVVFLESLALLARTSLAEPSGCTPVRKRQPKT